MMTPVRLPAGYLTVVPAPTSTAVRLIPWVLLIIMGIGITLGPEHGWDAQVYWEVGWPPAYRGEIDALDYQYSPAFAWWIQPLTVLPFDLFNALLVAAEIAALAYMVGPWIAALLIGVSAPLLWSELTYGNVNLLVGALVVAGFRSPWAWAFPILTKVTPGVGLVWFAVRREWRMLALAAGITVAVALPAIILSPQSWPQWLSHLSDNVGTAEDMSTAQAPLLLRWALAAGLVAWGALTNRPWLVPVAVVISAPVNWISWVMILGVMRLEPEIASRCGEPHLHSSIRR